MLNADMLATDLWHSTPEKLAPPLLGLATARCPPNNQTNQLSFTLPSVKFHPKKDFQPFFLITNLVVCLEKKSLTREVSLQENDQMRRSEFSGSDSETCTAWCWRVGIDGFLLLKCELVKTCQLVYLFLSIPFLGAFCEIDLWKRWQTHAGRMSWRCRFVVTQDLVQVSMTAWDVFGCCPSDIDMDGHFGLAKCECIYL